MAGPSPALYVIHGCDAYLRRLARAEVLRAFGQDRSAVVSFEGDVELSAVMDELRTASFLAPQRLVIVENADKFVAYHRDALERYLEQPAGTATLVLVLDSFPGNTRLAKKASEVGKLIACTAPKGPELLTYAVQFAQQREKKLAPQAARLLVEYVGSDLARLESEVEKLCLFVGQAQEIKPDDVQSTSIASAGPGDFELLNAIRDGRCAEALDLLDRTLTRRGLEFKVIGSLIWEYRRQLSGKTGPPWAGKHSRPSSSPASTATRQLPRLSPKQALRLLLQTDLALKSGANSPLTMQMLILRLCGGK